MSRRILTGKTIHEYAEDAAIALHRASLANFNGVDIGFTAEQLIRQMKNDGMTRVVWKDTKHKIIAEMYNKGYIRVNPENGICTITSYLYGVA
jgi:hypothetical protein